VRDLRLEKYQACCDVLKDVVFYRVVIISSRKCCSSGRPTHHGRPRLEGRLLAVHGRRLLRGGPLGVGHGVFGDEAVLLLEDGGLAGGLVGAVAAEAGGEIVAGVAEPGRGAAAAAAAAGWG
jgi:hypothetical protein